MTPTLAMVADREKEIQGFVPETFYAVALDMGDFTAVSRRLDTKEATEELLSAVRADANIPAEEVTGQSKTVSPPLLYDLTALQRDANRQYCYSAQQTLDYAQSLYEKKLITYPRTDSRYLCEDKADSLAELIEISEKKYSSLLKAAEGIFYFVVWLSAHIDGPLL